MANPNKDNEPQWEHREASECTVRSSESFEFEFHVPERLYEIGDTYDFSFEASVSPSRPWPRPGSTFSIDIYVDTQGTLSVERCKEIIDAHFVQLRDALRAAGTI